MTRQCWSTRNGPQIAYGKRDALHDGILLNKLPEGKPEVHFFDEKKMAGLDIDCLKNHYTSHAAAFMSHDEDKWWQSFFEDVEKLDGKLRKYSVMCALSKCTVNHSCLLLNLFSLLVQIKMFLS